MVNWKKVYYRYSITSVLYAKNHDQLSCMHIDEKGCNCKALYLLPRLYHCIT